MYRIRHWDRAGSHIHVLVVCVPQLILTHIKRETFRLVHIDSWPSNGPSVISIRPEGILLSSMTSMIVTNTDSGCIDCLRSRIVLRWCNGEGYLSIVKPQRHIY